tara:strand:+ start:1033 stop:1662 length:630 start_codon:yes stop_codon:yes gene_type:complete
MDNQLNFDQDSYFGLGMTATVMVLDNQASGVDVLFKLFDASGLNNALGVQPSSQKPTTEFALSTIPQAQVLADTTIQYPIKVVKMLYSVQAGDTALQFDALFEWTRANIDGTVRRGADIQSGLNQRNWMYTNQSSENSLVEINGAFTIDQNTACYINLKKGAKIQIVLLVDKSTYSSPQSQQINEAEYSTLIRPHKGLELKESLSEVLT